MKRAPNREGIRDPIMEVYSPPRVNSMANALGIASGFSLDLTEDDPDDWMPWDCTINEKRDKVMDMVLGKRALLLIGSPMCTAFSRLQNWNSKNMTKEKREELVNAGTSKNLHAAVQDTARERNAFLARTSAQCNELGNARSQRDNGT